MSKYKLLSELSRAEVARCIAKIEGRLTDQHGAPDAVWVKDGANGFKIYDPLTDFSIMGPIIERERYGNYWREDGRCTVYAPYHNVFSTSEDLTWTDSTWIAAAARLHIKLKLGVVGPHQRVELVQ